MRKNLSTLKDVLTFCRYVLPCWSKAKIAYADEVATEAPCLSQIPNLKLP